MTAKIDQTDWCDLLGVHWYEYQLFKMGQAPLTERTLSELADHFRINATDVQNGTVNFIDFAIRSESKCTELPERYQRAAFGRRRSSITSVQFVEDTFGWRLRQDVINKFEIPESQLLDPFQPISVLFITDLCGYLHQRGVDRNYLMQMGAYNYEMTSGSLIGQFYSQMRSPMEIYETFFSDSMIKMFEANCSYRIIRLNAQGGAFEVWSNHDVTAELGVRQIGSTHLCAFKAGHAASLTRYLGLSMAEIKETACVHHGDNCCRFEFSFPRFSC